MEDPTTPTAIGARLREIRKALGKTQVVFAGRAGISQNAYSQYEAGMRKPAVSEACKFLDAYGISLDFLYLGIKNPKRPK